jgi:hypothetical protein
MIYAIAPYGYHVLTVAKRFFMDDQSRDQSPHHVQAKVAVDDPVVVVHVIWSSLVILHLGPEE